MLLLLVVSPAYRRPVYEALDATLPGLTVWAGRAYFDPEIVTQPPAVGSFSAVENTFLCGRRLLWQRGVVREALDAAVLVAELNPRVLSTWVLLGRRRFRRRPTILWGHAQSRRGHGVCRDMVRRLMQRCADGVVVYTESEARHLASRLPGKPIVAAPNALYRAEQMSVIDPLAPTDFVFAGRLTEAKKPMLLMDAFACAIDRLPSDTRLVFVGGGPQRADLQHRATSAGIGERVRFAGEVFEIDALRRIYASAIASVSPGPVGLALIQSLGFGVPMLLARGEAHGPEIEAAVVGVNCCEFEPRGPGGLADLLVQAADNRERWADQRPKISAACRASYSVDAMAGRIAEVVTSMRRGT